MRVRIVPRRLGRRSRNPKRPRAMTFLTLVAYQAPPRGLLPLEHSSGL
jgi:hypothetical protein